MNIAIIIPTLYSGGAEKQSIYLAHSLSEKHRVTLIVLRGNLVEQKFLELLEKRSFNLVLLKGNLIVAFFKLLLSFSKNKPDFIFSYLASGNFFNALVGLLIGVKNRIGGIRNAELPLSKKWIEKLLHNYLLSKTISNSYSAVVNLSNHGFIKSKFSVIPNAFDLKEKIIIRSQKETVKIISLARFVPQKDYLTALKAINHLKDIIYDRKRLNFKYIIIGYGVLEMEIREHIRAFQLENEVEIIINPINVMDYLESSDIFLTTSLFEGTSNSVMEAMSYSLPVVTTDAGDNKLLIEHDKNGFVTSLKDFKSIAAYLAKLINDYELRIKFGELSYLKLKNEYSTEIFRNRYIEFMKKIEKNNL